MIFVNGSILYLRSFNRINSCRSIPTSTWLVPIQKHPTGFNRINSCRSIPTEFTQKVYSWNPHKVSIVSIHADQSRPLIVAFGVFLHSASFNRINSCRSIPTSMMKTVQAMRKICFNRINSCRSIPTWNRSWLKFNLYWTCFNRINSCRSIPTIKQQNTWSPTNLFQSYQFMQINPDPNGNLYGSSRDIGFNRINSCRSIPTWEQSSHGQQDNMLFQSYQFMQINPD